MTTQVRHPIWLPAVRPAGAGRSPAFTRWNPSPAPRSPASFRSRPRKSSAEQAGRVDPLHDVALLGLSATLFMPMLIERFSRRWVYTAACALAGARLGALRRRDAGRPSPRHAVSRHGRQRAVHHAQPLHHGPHPQDRVHPGGIAAHGLVDAAAGRPARRSACFSTPVSASWRRTPLVAGLRVASCSSLFWYFRLSDNPMIRPGQDPAGQSARQYRALRRAAAAAARLAHRLRPFLLLDDLLRLRRRS